MNKIGLLSLWDKNYKGYFMALGIFIFCFGSFTVMGQSGNTEKEIIGRWDITVDKNGDKVPSWLEVKLSGIRTLVGYFVADNGSARPISRVNVEDGTISFTIPPQWDDSDRDMEFKGRLSGDQLEGTIISSIGQKHSFVGERAPLMERSRQPKWGKTIDLFNGKNLEGWHTDKAENQWVVNNGILESPNAGANLISDEKFEDFKLHVDFRYPEGSNSGIFLRGRYEVQIEDNQGTPPSSIYFGGIYGFLTPNEMAVESAGVWQTFDITLIGRRVTIIANGKEIICDQIIPGITGGALDSNEGQPGPIMLQGDHGAVEFRKIEITPAK